MNVSKNDETLAAAAAALARAEAAGKAARVHGGGIVRFRDGKEVKRGQAASSSSPTNSAAQMAPMSDAELMATAEYCRKSLQASQASAQSPAPAGRETSPAMPYRDHMFERWQKDPLGHKEFQGYLAWGERMRSQWLGASESMKAHYKSFEGYLAWRADCVAGRSIVKQQKGR